MTFVVDSLAVCRNPSRRCNLLTPTAIGELSVVARLKMETEETIWESAQSAKQIEELVQVEQVGSVFLQKLRGN